MFIYAQNICFLHYQGSLGTASGVRQCPLRVTPLGFLYIYIYNHHDLIESCLMIYTLSEELTHFMIHNSHTPQNTFIRTQIKTSNFQKRPLFTHRPSHRPSQLRSAPRSGSGSRPRSAPRAWCARCPGLGERAVDAGIERRGERVGKGRARIGKKNMLIEERRRFF